MTSTDQPGGLALRGVIQPVWRATGMVPPSYVALDGAPFQAPAEQVPSFLTLESLNETVNIGDSDGERRMTFSPKWRRNGLAKMDAHSRGPIGPKREAIVGK